MTLQVGARLGPYEILSALGAGGMGEVYRALDTRLKRDVAIKVLSPEITADPRLRARFEREAHAVAALNHPHVVTIHDVGESDGTLYIAFELIEGETLQQLLDGGPLPLGRALDLAVQLVDGLAHAHDAGVVHRDLKPGNVMVTADGRVKVLDFGLGKFVRSPALASTTTMSSVISEAGTVLGTIGYMSPEQVRGDPVDERADQFVFGAVLYEMVVGARAFRRDKAMQTLSAILHDEPRPLEEVAPHAPASLARVVSRCLAKRPDDRYPSTRELLGALRAVVIDLDDNSWSHHWRRRGWKRWAAVAASFLAVVVLAGVGRGLIPVPPSAVPSAPSAITTLSLLPLEADSANPADRAYWAGLTEAITTRLAALPTGRRLHVTPASDVAARRVQTPRDARLELGATHVIRGTMVDEGAQIRARLELVETSSSRTIRTTEVVSSHDEGAARQNRLLDAVLSLAEVTLTASERTSITAPMAAAGVHDFYLQGLGYLQDDSKPDNIDTAIAVFQNALKLDPKHAPAHAGLGEAYWRKYLSTRETRWAETARQTCERALGLDETEAAPHRCLGTVASGIGEYEKAAEEFQHAIAREPDSEVAHIGLANAYDRLGLPSRAEDVYLEAISLRPRYWNGYSRLGAFYYTQRRYADAERMFREVVALNPDSWRGYSNLGALYYVQERTPDAVAAYQTSMAIRPNYQAASNLGTLYFFDLGDYPKAVQAFQQAVDLNDGEYVVWGNLATALYWGGRAAEARPAFHRAAELAERRLAVNPRDAQVTMSLAEYEAAVGRDSRARDLMDRALMLSPGDARLMFQAGVLCELWFKERDTALEWLGRALEGGYQWKEVERSPALSALRRDPRGEQLRQRAAPPDGGRR